MPAYEDQRDGRWRYRKRVDLPDGRRIRITGTPATDTKKAAEAAERAHIDRVLHPERARAQAAAVPERKEKTTFREFAKRFMAGYLPGQKPSERKAKNQILNTHLIPFFGHMALDEIRQEHVDAFTTAELKRCARKTVNNRLAVLSTLLGYAVENKVIAKVTLRCHVRGRKAEDAPILAVEADDVQKLLVAAVATYRGAILLATEAGFRVGEIRGVQWTDVRGDEVTIRRAIDSDDNVGAPKHDRVRKVPLSPAFLTELQQLPRRGLWVLCSADGVPLPYREMLDTLHRIYQRAGRCGAGLGGRHDDAVALAPAYVRHGVREARGADPDAPGPHGPHGRQDDASLRHRDLGGPPQRDPARVRRRKGNRWATRFGVLEKLY
jgi:integrase